MFIDTAHLASRSAAAEQSQPLQQSQLPQPSQPSRSTQQTDLQDQHDLLDNITLLPHPLTPRMIKFFLLPAVLLTALFTKEYTGELQMVINNQVGGVFYVLFGSLLFSYIFRRMKIWHAVSLALGIICMLEVLQSFQFQFITFLSQNTVLAFLFGNSFNPADFMYYGFGAVAGLLTLWILKD